MIDLAYERLPDSVRDPLQLALGWLLWGATVYFTLIVMRAGYRLWQVRHDGISRGANELGGALVAGVIAANASGISAALLTFS